MTEKRRARQKMITVDMRRRYSKITEERRERNRRPSTSFFC